VLLKLAQLNASLSRIGQGHRAGQATRAIWLPTILKLPTPWTLAFDAKDHKWALDLLRESARQLGDQAEVRYDLAWSYFSLGQLPEAMSSMQSALQAKKPLATNEPAQRFLAMTALARIRPKRWRQPLKCRPSSSRTRTMRRRSSPLP